MAAKPAAQEPLDRLQTQVHSVLFQLGRVFKHAHNGDTKALHQAKEKASNGIPVACTDFHESLDTLQQDLLRARTVIVQDLQLIQEKRAAREKAAGAARLQAKAANGQPVKKEPGTGDEPKGDMEMIGQEANSQVTNGSNGQSASQVGADASAATAAIPTDLDADLESIFADGFGDMSASDNAGAASQQTGAGDTQGSIDALFGGDVGFDDSFGLNSGDGGGEDDIDNLLPGLEKYGNQGQENSATANPGANGQNAGASNDDLDLDALISSIGGGNESKPVSDSNTTATIEGGQTKDEDDKPTNDANKDTNGASEEKKDEDPIITDFMDESGDIDMTFEFDFMGGDGNANGGNDLDNFFDFN